MYSQLLPSLAAERVCDIRREAKAASRARRIRPGRPGHRGHRAGRRAAAPASDVRLMPRAAR
jgi:hypothetical protein